jgi:hypothetical protein
VVAAAVHLWAAVSLNRDRGKEGDVKMDMEELMRRLVILETVIGDDNRGLLSELGRLRKAVDELKEFQLKALGGFVAVGVALQILVQIGIKHL